MAGYLSPQGPLLREPLAAMAKGATFEEFLPEAVSLVRIRGDLLRGSFRTRKVPSLARRLGVASRRFASVSVPSFGTNGDRWAATVVSGDRCPDLAREIYGIVMGLPIESAVKGLIPGLAMLADLDGEMLKAASKRVPEAAKEYLAGLVEIAACASRRQPAPGAALFVQFSDHDDPEQIAEATWIDLARARQLYETNDAGAFAAAARAAALRDSGVKPPSHECRPEAVSLLVPNSYQELLDDETDLLAVEFLLQPLGLLPPADRSDLDWIRPLDPEEVAAILKRMADLGKLSPEELFAQAGRFLEPDGGGVREGGYAGELQGMIRESTEKLFAAAAKKKEPITLVACKDWLGNKKA